MSIITKPSSIVKGVEASITLNKVDLASVVASMGTDAYYEDSSNWSKVILQYGSSIGNQKEIISFDATQSSPTSTFLVSDKALDIFEVHKIIIVDFDGGVFSIPRSELVTAEFDIDTTLVASLYSRDFSSPNTAQAYETLNSFSIVQGSFLEVNSYNTGEKGIYQNFDTSFSFISGNTYTVRTYVNSYDGNSSGINILLASEVMVLISPATILTSIGGYFDTVFTAIPAQASSPERIRYLGRATTGGNTESFLKISKIEIL